MDIRPIGIFDSGSGGLSVWQSVVSMLPHESTVYFGDHSFLPYSKRTKADIRRRGISCIKFLLSEKAKIIIVACNTATVAGIQYFRQVFPDIPVVGVVPVIKTAAERSKTRTFCVLATKFTVKSPYQKQLIRTFASSCRVYSVFNSKLVTSVENGEKNTMRVQKILRDLLTPLIKKNIDIVVLGCTHFPFMKAVIEDIVGPDVMVLDSGQAVARHVKRILEHEHITASGHTPTHRFFTSGDPEKVSRVASLLLGKPIVVERVASYVQ